MKIVIIGKGQIGSALFDALHTHEITQWAHDIADLSSDALERLSPDVVINAAGRTDLRWCEDHAREAFRSNVEAPIELYMRIQRMKHRPRYLHFSSGCVWDGPYDENGKPFTPNSAPTPAAYYSWTKASCDALLLQRDPGGVAILRPRQVFSHNPSPRSTLTKLCAYEGLIDTPNSVSSIEIITKTVRYLLDGSDWTGIWNIYDKGVTTPFTIGKMLAEAGLRNEPKPLTKSELDSFHKPKRVDTVLYDERFERLIKPDDVTAVLHRMIDAYATNIGVMS